MMILKAITVVFITIIIARRITVIMFIAITAIQCFDSTYRAIASYLTPFTPGATIPRLTPLHLHYYVHLFYQIRDR